MKLLKDLKAQYDSNGIAELVDFASKAPVRLPEGQNYQFRKEGSIVHIYGMASGINEYHIDELAQGMVFQGARKTPQGTALDLLIGGVEQIILHSKPYKPGKGNAGQTQSQPLGQVHYQGTYQQSSESQTGRESRSNTTPAKGIGESRTGSQGSHGNGESRTPAWQGVTGGESRGGSNLVGGGESRTTPSESRPSPNRSRGSNRGGGSSESRGGSHGGESR